MTGSVSDVGLSFIYPHDINDPIRDALRRDCVAYWKMDEWSGTRMDATGNGRNLSEIGTVRGVPGKINNAADVNVENENGLKRINDLTFRSQGEKTISFCGWLRINDFDPTIIDHTIVWSMQKDNFNAPFTDYYLFFNPFSSKITLDVYDANDNEIGFIIHSQIIVEGQSYFFVFKIDSVAEMLYLRINNNEESSAFSSSPVGTSPYADHSFSLGCEVNFLSPDVAQHQINGNIDELGFWQKNLSQDEANYLYNNGNGVSLFP